MLEEDGASDADGFGGGGWLGAVLEPVRWLRMLCRELGTTFVAGVVLVYGLSQGFASSFYRVASDYYWKDVQQLQPATVQLLTVFFFLPWVLKPLWGVMTDVFPIRGYRRRPYFLFSGILGTTSAAAVAMITGLPVTSAVICFVGISTGVAIADVTIDACIAKNSIDKPALAPDMQSLCAFSSSLGALIGYATSGMFVHHLGAQGALGLMAIPPAMLVFLGFFIYELQTYQHSAKAKVLNKVSVAVKGMIQTIKYPVVWKPSLYMFLSLALSISTHEGQFYWYTNKTAHNPGFSQIFGKGFKMAQPIRLSHKDDYRAMAAPDLGSATPDPTTCVRERTEGYTRGHTGSGVVARDLRDVARGVLVGATPASGGATHRRTLRRSTGSTQSTEG